MLQFLILATTIQIIFPIKFHKKTFSFTNKIKKVPFRQEKLRENPMERMGRMPLNVWNRMEKIPDSFFSLFSKLTY